MSGPALMGIKESDVPTNGAGAADWSRFFADYGVALLPGVPGQKRPKAEGWQKPEAWICDPEAAEAHWLESPDDLLGANLGGSGLASFDVDSEDETRTALAAVGLDLDVLLHEHAVVRGRGRRAIYAEPSAGRLRAHGIDRLRHLKLEYQRDDKKIVVFEIRAGNGCQDILPPSMHPSAGRYQWERAPWQTPERGVAELPDELLKLVSDWRELEGRMLAAIGVERPAGPAPGAGHRKPGTWRAAVAAAGVWKIAELARLPVDERRKALACPVCKASQRSSRDARLPVSVFDDGQAFRCHAGSCPAKGDALSLAAAVVLGKSRIETSDEATLVRLWCIERELCTARDEGAPELRRLGDILLPSVERAERRAAGIERPVPLPWPELRAHFGGGLWAGLHMLCSGTGAGKTQLALQAAVWAARNGYPVLYIGLELGELDLALRVLGEAAEVPWAALWIGQAGQSYLDRVREAVPRLGTLPFYYEVARPHGFAPSAIRAAVESLREQHPEPDGPGSLPVLVVLDFLQIVGDEDGQAEDTRIRIGRAAYVLRDAANRLGAAVLCISSIARERYKVLADIREAAGLECFADELGRPQKRRVLQPDAVVGMGKESGELEYSADSVSILAKVGDTWDGTGCDAIFVTAKGRATGATWSVLHFTGFGYEEPEDGGAAVLEAWADAKEKKERARDERQSAKDRARAEKVKADAEGVRAYVLAHPGCSVREARVNAVGDSGRRWTAAVAQLGAQLVQTQKGKGTALSIAACVDSVDSVDGPPKSTSTLLRGPWTWKGGVGGNRPRSTHVTDERHPSQLWDDVPEDPQP